MLINALLKIPDHRRAQARKYELGYVLFFCILSILCGAKSYRKMHIFIKAHLKTFKKVFRIKWKRSPGYATIRYIISEVNISEIEESFRNYTNELLKIIDDGKEVWTINIDGKSLKGMREEGIDNSVQQLMAYLSTHRMVLAHLDITDFEKTNEIPKAQQMIRELDFVGKVFTMDALHNQKKLLNWLTGVETFPFYK